MVLVEIDFDLPYKYVCALNISVNYLVFQLPNHVFEELVMDVYDEVDRRQTEASEYNLFNAFAN